MVIFIGSLVCVWGYSLEHLHAEDLSYSHQRSPSRAVYTIPLRLSSRAVYTRTLPPRLSSRAVYTLTPRPPSRAVYIRIQATVMDPCGSGSNPCYLSIFGNCKQNHLQFNQLEESINYLPFLFHTYYSPAVCTQSPEFTDKLTLLPGLWIRIHFMRIQIHQFF